MNNLLSYFGLVDAKIKASDKDLPVKVPLSRQNKYNKMNVNTTEYFLKSKSTSLIATKKYCKCFYVSILSQWIETLFDEFLLLLLHFRGKKHATILKYLYVKRKKYLLQRSIKF